MKSSHQIADKDHFDASSLDLSWPSSCIGRIREDIRPPAKRKPKASRDNPLALPERSLAAAAAGAAEARERLEEITIEVGRRAWLTAEAWRAGELAPGPREHLMPPKEAVEEAAWEWILEGVEQEHQERISKIKEKRGAGAPPPERTSRFFRGGDPEAGSPFEQLAGASGKLPPIDMAKPQDDDNVAKPSVVAAWIESLHRDRPISRKEMESWQIEMEDVPELSRRYSHREYASQQARILINKISEAMRLENQRDDAEAGLWRLSRRVAWHLGLTTTQQKALHFWKGGEAEKGSKQEELDLETSIKLLRNATARMNLALLSNSEGEEATKEMQLVQGILILLLEHLKPALHPLISSEAKLAAVAYERRKGAKLSRNAPESHGRLQATERSVAWAIAEDLLAMANEEAQPTTGGKAPIPQSMMDYLRELQRMLPPTEEKASREHLARQLLLSRGEMRWEKMSMSGEAWVDEQERWCIEQETMERILGPGPLLARVHQEIAAGLHRSNGNRIYLKPLPEGWSSDPGISRTILERMQELAMQGRGMELTAAQICADKAPLSTKHPRVLLQIQASWIGRASTASMTSLLDSAEELGDRRDHAGPTRELAEFMEEMISAILGKERSIAAERLRARLPGASWKLISDTMYQHMDASHERGLETARKVIGSQRDRMSLKQWSEAATRLINCTRNSDPKEEKKSERKEIGWAVSQMARSRHIHELAEKLEETGFGLRASERREDHLRYITCWIIAGEMIGRESSGTLGSHREAFLQVFASSMDGRYESVENNSFCTHAGAWWIERAGPSSMAAVLGWLNGELDGYRWPAARTLAAMTAAQCPWKIATVHEPLMAPGMEGPPSAEALRLHALLSSASERDGLPG